MAEDRVTALRVARGGSSGGMSAFALRAPGGHRLPLRSGPLCKDSGWMLKILKEVTVVIQVQGGRALLSHSGLHSS